MKTNYVDLGIKQKLQEACLTIQQKLADTTSAAMQQAQESANEEKGTMGDKFESFREQCQLDRDMYARQLQEILMGLTLLRKIDIGRPIDSIMPGAVVITDSQLFFIAISLGEVRLDDKSYFAISTQTPLYKAMAGKKKGESFEFRGKVFRVVDMY